jgi:hypothetical protein
VRLHDCALAESELSTAQTIRVMADRFFATYEADLLPAARPDPSAPPIPIIAEHLAEQFGTDLKQSYAAYRYKVLQVTGKVLERNIQTNTIVFETSTSHRYQVAVVFTPAHFAALRSEKTTTLRGTCVGLRGNMVRLENGERYDPDRGNATVRTTADYFPFQAGTEAVRDFLVPEKLKDNSIVQYRIRFVAPDLVRATPTRGGLFPAASLFAEPASQPKWNRDFTKPTPKVTPPPTLITQYRASDEGIELREIPPAPLQPSQWWDPVMRLGAKKGESWSSEMPDGRVVTYTVMAFIQDEQQRQLVEIRRIVKNPRVAISWEEETRTYALGIGEIKRVASRQFVNGNALTTLEMKVAESPDSKDPNEPKDKDPTEPDRPDKKESGS